MIVVAGIIASKARQGPRSVDASWLYVPMSGVVWQKQGLQHYDEVSHDAAIPTSLKKPRMQPPEMIGSVKLSSNDPRSV